MWPFAKRGSQQRVIAPKPTDWPNLEDFEKSDVSLKVWLPQILIDRINWISKNLEVSRPDILRAQIFENIYGRVAFEALCRYAEEKQNAQDKATRREIYDKNNWSTGISKAFSSEDIKFSKERFTNIDLAHLGKSDEDLTLTLPQQLKTDLALVAKMHEITPSSYVRKLLVLHLLGEKVHSEWQRALGKLPNDLSILEK